MLQDGASAIYGSDAIAGVVNIITKKRQKGFDATAQLGGYQEGDGFTQNYSLSWGNGDEGPLEVVVGGNYVKQGSVSSGDRAISAFPAPYSTTCADGGCSGFPLMGRFIVLRDPSLPGDFDSPEDPPLHVGTNKFLDLTLNGPVFGGPPVYDPLNPTGAATDFHSFGTADRFNFAPFNYLQIPIERYGVFANVRYEVADNINFSVKGWWNERKSKNQAAPLPSASDRAPASRRFSTGQRSTLPIPSILWRDLDASNMTLVYRRFIEGGPHIPAEGRYKLPTATLMAGSTCSSMIGTGTLMAPMATTRPSKRCSATSTRRI